MYSRRARNSSQSSIQNLSGYMRTGSAPRGAVSLRGLGSTVTSQMRRNFNPEGGDRFPLINIYKPFATPAPADSVAPQQSITPDLYTSTSSNYVATPSSPAAADASSAATASTGFSLSDVPWWGWALAAYLGYSVFSGTGAR